MYSTTVDAHNLKVLNSQPFLKNVQSNEEVKRVFKSKARPCKSLGFLGVSYSQAIDYEPQCKKGGIHVWLHAILEIFDFPSPNCHT